MSSLIGQNIGGNPRGILNLGATINTPLDTTLRNVTDGLGNNSPLQLSTTQVSVVAARNYNTLFVGGSAASGIRVSNSSDAAANGWNLSVNGSAAAYFSIAFGTSAIYSTSAISFNSSDLTTLVNKNLYVGYNDAAFPNASARLHVRGDGTNPIARFENSGGTASHIFKDTTALEFGTQGNYIAATANGLTTSTAGRGLLFSGVSGQSIYQFNFLASNNSESSGTWGGINLTGGVTAGAGSGNFRPLNIAYTINNSGAQTGTATGIFLNATETALNGMGHRLMDLQVGGVSQFRIKSDGIVENIGYYTGVQRLLFNGGSYAVNRGIISAPSDGVYTFMNASETSFSRLQLGGTTNAFPAIKRNGAAIDFRLADDSAFCSVNSLSYAFGDGNISITQAALGCILMTISPQFSTNSGLRVRTNSNFNTDASANAFSVEANLTKTFSVTQTNQVLIGSGTVNASAILQADSTTRGFLPPRLTTAQRDLIGTPAAGLMIYNTSTNRPNFYDGSAWVAL